MCYHYSILKTAKEISEHYGIPLKSDKIDPDPLFYHINSFNPDFLPVVYQDYSDNHLKFDFMRWGLVPALKTA